MRVAVTGGTGFLGAHSVVALQDAGHELRLLVRSRHSLGALSALGVRVGDIEVVEGDVCDPVAVDRLLDGSQSVLHSAGVVGFDRRSEADMWHVNVNATAQLLSRAVQRGLDPIVYVSSYSAVFPSPDDVIGPDSPTTDGARSVYGRTKSAADHIARGLQAGGAPIVITYPSSVVGPPAGDNAGMTANGWAPLLRYGVSISFEGAITMIDVRDVAAVHAAVMEPGRGSRRYMCGGEMVPFDEVLDILERASKRRLRRVSISPRTLRFAGKVFDRVSGIVRLPPAFSYEAAWLLTNAKPTDDTATSSDLGLHWRPARRSLEESVTGVPRRR